MAMGLYDLRIIQTTQDRYCHSVGYIQLHTIQMEQQSRQLKSEQKMNLKNMLKLKKLHVKSVSTSYSNNSYNIDTV